MNKKCVVLLSGGIDSTVLLYSLVHKYECYPLTIDYGQRHFKECIAARNVCEARDHNLLLRHKYLNLEVLQSLLPSSLTGKGEIPEGHYTEESMGSTVVPNRNAIFLSTAYGYAMGIGAGYVAYAAHSGDHTLYADCRPEFFTKFAEAERLATGVKLLVPFGHLDKVDIVRRGARLTVPFRLCWSCYRGEDRPCLQCGTCIERTLAFRGAGLADPALTEDEWREALRYAEQ